MERKLTDEQIERAACAAYESEYIAPKWHKMCKSDKETWIKFVKVAAPYLQYEAEPVSRDLLERCIKAFDAATYGGPQMGCQPLSAWCWMRH